MGENLNFVWTLLQTIFALAAVCGLAYVIFRVILPRLQLVQNSGGMIRVVERVGLDAKRSLYVVEVAGKWMLVGTSENGINLVGELNEADATAAEAVIAGKREAQIQRIENIRTAFGDKLASVMNRKNLKKGAKNDENGKKQPLWFGKK